MGFVTLRSKSLTGAKARRFWAMLRSIPIDVFVPDTDAGVAASAAAKQAAAVDAARGTGARLSTSAAAARQRADPLAAATTALGTAPCTAKLYFYHSQQDLLPAAELPAAMLRWAPGKTDVDIVAHDAATAQEHFIATATATDAKEWIAALSVV